MILLSSGCDGYIERVSILINLLLNSIAGLITVNKLLLKIPKNELVSSHHNQCVLEENDISHLMTNITLIERVTEINIE